MARVTTKIIDESAAGGTASEAALPTKLALNAATKAVTVTAVVTAAPATKGSLGRLYMVTSPVDITAAAAVLALKRQAYVKDFNWPFDTHNTHIQTAPRIAQGDYLYIWFELPKEIVGTLSAWATEV